MNKKKNKVYDAPALTVVTFKTEHGYAASLTQKMTFGLWSGDSGDNAGGSGVSDYADASNNGGYWNW